MNAFTSIESVEPVVVPPDGMFLSLWKGLIAAPSAATMRSIAQATAADHGIPFHHLFAPSRKRPIAFARFDFMWRCRQARQASDHFRFSYPQIGAFLGLDHSSVIHGVRQWEKILSGERS